MLNKRDIVRNVVLAFCLEVKSCFEPNNPTGITKHIEIIVSPLDLLDEFLKVTLDPPKEYIPLRNAQGYVYYGAVNKLKRYVEERNNKNVGGNVLNKNISNKLRQ